MKSKGSLSRKRSLRNNAKAGSGREISRTYEEWVRSRLVTNKERKPAFHSISFIEKPLLVVPKKTTAQKYSQQLGFPGEYPFTRGIHPTMYRGRLWTMRQFAGFGSPEDTNKRFKFLLAHGQTGLSTAFDMPTLMGYDPDHEFSRGEVGREGVSVATLEDMDCLFAGVDLAAVTTSMTINATATIAMAFYIALAKCRGIPLSRIGGTIQNDMLKEFIAQKEWICPPGPSVGHTCDIIEFCSKHLKKFNAVSISGYHIREAGATAVQELAFTIADGLEYVEQCLRRKMKIDDFAPRLSFFFDIHNDFFEEVAKLRAARGIWAKLMRSRFGAKNARSMMLRTHAQTAGVSLTAQQPMNNVVRVALQAFAGVLGGVQSLHTNSMDETYALPTEGAVRVALRTQQIIAEESGAAEVVDPLGGSYFIEELTDRIESQAEAYISEIDLRGGMLKAVEQGYPQHEIAEASYRLQKEFENGQRTTVGIHNYNELDDEFGAIPTLTIDEKVERRQIRQLKAFKRSRGSRVVGSALKVVERACRKGKNIMPSLIDAVIAGATLGEISNVYRLVWGCYKDPGNI